MKSVFADIYARAPINKTASLVTAQSDCLPEDSLEQKRESLVARWRQIESSLSGLDKGSGKRAALIEEKRAIEANISSIRAQLKLRPKNLNLSEFIIQVLKERTTKIEFMRLVDEAERRYKKQQAESEVNND